MWRIRCSAGSLEEELLAESRKTRPAEWRNERVVNVTLSVWRALVGSYTETGLLASSVGTPDSLCQALPLARDNRVARSGAFDVARDNS